MARTHTRSERSNGGISLWDTSEKRQHLCQEYCKHLSEGFTLGSFRSCAKTTLYKYMKKYPEDFNEEQIELAMQQGRYLLESKMLAGTESRTFNGYAMIGLLKNRFSDWREQDQKSKIELSGSENNPIKIVVKTVLFGKIDEVKKDEGQVNESTETTQ